MWNFIIGHLIGDFIFQSDWEANNKTWTNRRWFGLLVAMWHSLYIAALVYVLFFLSGQNIELWKIIALWATHALQDWTRFPFRIMACRGQFEGIKDKKNYLYINFENSLNAKEGMSIKQMVDLCRIANHNPDSPIQGKESFQHSYLWACFVVDQVWHFATYYLLFIL